MRILAFTFLFIPILLFSQGNKQSNAAQIKLKLRKLDVLGSVLYVAAHPDDENTRIITYMGNDRLAATAYLSMTRGDGGQNLIGPELRDQLGLIRTQELLSARRIDGGQQFFTRANDFGYSKSATETFRIWGKDQVFADVVKVFRQYQPDVIITRFPPDERAGHGHHTASAMLAQEAFDAAAKSEIYPDQVKQFGTWQAKGLYTNTSRYWNTTINENTPGIITLNVGRYSPLLGTSFTEIAAISRSQHKSQGFGSAGVRGDQLEFLEFEKGERAQKDIFEGVNTSWSRVKGGEKVQPLVTRAIREFDTEKPAAIVPLLFQIRKEIQKLEPGIWRERKLKETDILIQDCLGLYVEVTSGHYEAAPGENVTARIELVNRSTADIVINHITVAALGLDSAFALPLQNNADAQLKTTRKLDSASPYSSPYWLTNPHGIGLFQVADPGLIGKPENDPAVNAIVSMTIGGEPFTVIRPMIYKWTDPAKGELTRPFEIVPPVFVSLSSQVFIFNDGASQQIKVTLKSTGDTGMQGVVRLQVPAGWRTEPASIPFELKKHDEELTRTFSVFPSSKEETGILKAVAEVNGKAYDRSVQRIQYDHIPTQTLMPLAEAKVVRMDLQKEGSVIGYIKGAGDDIPASLRYVGYEVWEMKNEEVKPENLKRVDAVVLGIRALNTNDRIRFMMPVLLEYVKQGGTLVVQYNNGNMDADSIAPYPLDLSRERVTEEDAEVRMLKPDHLVLNKPNKITAKDFDGWVQERGLYFPNRWDDHFEPILSMNDKGESPLNGSLLVAKYGNGYYVYTGLSFFRELPEGVAGAYKLFTNIVSLHTPKPEAVAAKPKKKRSK